MCEMTLILPETVSQLLSSLGPIANWQSDNSTITVTWTLNIRRGCWLWTGRNQSNSLQVNFLRVGKHGDWLGWVLNSSTSLTPQSNV